MDIQPYFLLLGANMTTIVKQSVIDECESYYMPYKVGGDKIKAIKYFREQTGIGLKDAKELIEAGFDSASMYNMGIEVEDTDTAGYHVDKIFELASKLAYHYAEMKKLGVSIGGS
jgi:hypothetical protein